MDIDCRVATIVPRIYNRGLYTPTAEVGRSTRLLQKLFYTGVNAPFHADPNFIHCCCRHATNLTAMRRGCAIGCAGFFGTRTVSTPLSRLALMSSTST